MKSLDCGLMDKKNCDSRSLLQCQIARYTDTFNASIVVSTGTPIIPSSISGCFNLLPGHYDLLHVFTPFNKFKTMHYVKPNRNDNVTLNIKYLTFCQEMVPFELHIRRICSWACLGTLILPSKTHCHDDVIYVQNLLSKDS